MDLSALARDIAAELQYSAPERQVHFTIADGIRVEGDPTLLRVMLDNLLGNAWKYSSREAGACIDFGMETVDGQPTCYVRDNGVGFDMRYAEKLFQPFQRLHGNDEFEGTGIGLAIVQRIVARHNGTVWATAAPGEGTTVYFRLPAR